MTCAPLLQHTGLQEICCYQKSLFITQSWSSRPDAIILKPSYCISLLFFSPIKPDVFSPCSSASVTHLHCHPSHLGGYGSIGINQDFLKTDRCVFLKHAWVDHSSISFLSPKALNCAPHTVLHQSTLKIPKSNSHFPAPLSPWAMVPPPLHNAGR